jgi:hypothetical protein
LTSIFTLADIANFLQNKFTFKRRLLACCVDSFLKDSTQSSFENQICMGIFAMSASGKKDVNRSFKQISIQN